MLLTCWRLTLSSVRCFAHTHLVPLSLVRETATCNYHAEPEESLHTCKSLIVIVFATHANTSVEFVQTCSWLQCKCVSAVL